MNKEWEREAKTLAKNFFGVAEKLNDKSIYGMRKDLIREEYNDILMQIINRGIRTDTITQYIEEYKKLKLGELSKWLNGEL